MSLSPEEQAELQQLRKEFSGADKIAQFPVSDLAPQEQDELRALREEFGTIPAPDQPQDRPVQAAIQGFGNAASFGYLPQIQAGVEKGVDFLFGDDADEKLRAQGFDVQTPTYTETRDNYIQDKKSLEKSNPVASLIGEISGAITTGIATGGALGSATNLGKAATVGSRFKDAAKTGAFIGAVRNPGDKEGDVDLFQIRDRIKNASIDAVTGAALQGGAEVVGKAAKAIKDSPTALKHWSQIKSFKTSGAMLKDFRKAYGNKRVNELGQTMIDNKLVELGDDVADIAKKAEFMKAQSGNKIGKIYEHADDILEDAIGPTDFRLNTEKIANDFKADLAKRYQNNVDADEILGKVDKVLEAFQKNKTPSFKELRDLRQSIDDKINYARSSNDLPAFQDEMLKFRNLIQDKVKDSLGKIDKGLQQRFIKENRNFSNLAEISKIAKDKVARDSSNAAFGLRERISGGAGAVLGGMIGANLGGPVGTAVGGVIGNQLGSITTKIAKQYGTPFVAIAANRAARVLENNGSMLGKFAEPLMKVATSPKEFVATIDLLMRDPEFKKTIQGININKFDRGLAGGK